jgi:hypothetical protein
MKKTLISLGFITLVTGFLFVSTQAQQNPTSFFAVFEEFVTPADIPAFNEAQQKAVDLWKKNQMDISLYCYRTDDNSFFWVTPLENFGSLDGIFKKMSESMKKMKEVEGFDPDKEFRDLSTGRQSVIMWSADMSYHPDGNMGQSVNERYVEWMFCSLKAGHEKEASEAVKKYIEFYKNSNESYDWDVYVSMFGYDTPMWILMTRAESPEAMRKQEAELNKKYNKEFSVMWNDFAKHLRKTEMKTGWYKPDWSINTAQ